MVACASAAGGAGGQPAAVAAAPLPLGADWTTYHGDAARAGYAPDGPDPTAPAVAWKANLDGAVYASPIVVGGLLVAATEGGSLYGLDAATGAVRWRTHLADPV